MRALLLALSAAAVAAITVTLPAVADAPVREPSFVRLSERGPAFLAYDGGASFDHRQADWPVSLVFVRRARIGRIKKALRELGFNKRGEARYLAYRVGDRGPRFDSDRGLKTACDSNGTDLHVRLYAPGAHDRFLDPEYGSVVVGTTHFDRADGCGVPPRLFGFSELAERRLGLLIGRRLGWGVRPNRLQLGNAEPYRRDTVDPAHVWLADGRATVIAVP